MHSPVKLGISTCLLGERVRYDGSHKLDWHLKDVLGKFIEWMPVCPETECGMSIPRPAIQLENDPEAPRLIVINTREDKTDQMQTWTEKRLAEFEKEDLCGFIFKTKSPSCGMININVFSNTGRIIGKSAGLFARAFMERFPQIPAEDEDGLHDSDLRENFIERVFIFRRWKESLLKEMSISNLVQFHSEHKYLLMAHSPMILRELGKIVADTKGQPPQTVFDRYFKRLMEAMEIKATVKKHVNVMHHMMGYFKKVLSADEKKELLEVIEQYHQSLIPLIGPVTLMNHYVHKYNEPYLKRQVYLNPSPTELMLQNHV